MMLAVVGVLLFAAALWAAPADEDVVYAPAYRFDDVFGPSGSRAQWVTTVRYISLVEEDDELAWPAPGTIGGAASGAVRAGADLAASRDHAYVLNENPWPSTQWWPNHPPAIETLFLVMPGNTANLRVAFGKYGAYTDEPYAHDVLTDLSAYQAAVKKPLDTSDGTWEFTLTKTSDTGVYNTKRGNLIFTQNPADTPSQTLQIPMIVANVYNGTADEENPLLFRATMRDRSTGTGTALLQGGNIVAYDRFTWDVVNDKAVGDEGADWVLVPVTNYPIDSNNVNYYLSTEVTNYTGVRYALQRYDRLGNVTPIYPTKWTADLPSDVLSASSDIELHLDELSHIPPGLITTYSNQSFNVVSGVQSIFDLYPVDPASGHRRLELSHPSIFGVSLGRVGGGNSDDHEVTGFRLLPANPNFLNSVAAAMGVKGAAMPDGNGFISGAVTTSFVTSDAINTITVDKELPLPDLVTSGDTAGVLPLHITLNLPHSNRLVRQRWDEFYTVWREKGDIKDTFAKYFSVFTYDAKGNAVDLFNWLEGRGAFDRTVKVFLDESRDCITVTFIAMLMDGEDKAMAMVQDKTITTDNSYLVMKDGNLNDAWDMTFLTAPVDYSPANPSGGGSTGGGSGSSGGGSSSGGGGGCGAGMSVWALLAVCGFALARKVRGERK